MAAEQSDKLTGFIRNLPQLLIKLLRCTWASNPSVIMGHRRCKEVPLVVIYIEDYKRRKFIRYIVMYYSQCIMGEDRIF